MPNRPIIIDSFISVSGVAEIVGIGRLRHPRGQAQEVEVEVIVASNLEKPDFNLENDVACHWIGCGQLDLLAPGSRWLEGKLVGWAEARTVEAKFEWVREESIGIGAPPRSFDRPFPSDLFASVQGFVLRRVPAIGEAAAPLGDPKFVLLPPMELLRALFGVSNNFLLELFDGIRDPAVSGDRGLVSQRLSRVRDDGTVVLVAGRDLLREEAIVAAAIISDKKFRAFYHSAFQQLSVDPEARAGRPSLLNVSWPWEAPVPIKLKGRWVHRVNASPRFIVVRLEAIGFPLPFSRVEVQHPGSGKSGGEDSPPSDSRVRTANVKNVVLTTGRAASTGRRPTEVRTGSLEFSTANDIEVVSVACGNGVRRDRAVIGEEPRDAAPFGSGGRQPSADPEVGAATVRRKARPGEATERTAVAALNMTWNALEAACNKRGWQLRAMPRGGQPNSGPGQAGFEFGHEPLVALVMANGKRLVVVDRGSPTGDECSLGLLVPRASGLGTTDAMLAPAARRACAVIDGRWRSRALLRDPPSEFAVIAVNRDARVWQSCEFYAMILERRLALALGV